MASGVVRQARLADGQVVYVSGDLTQPEPGRFFFQKQARPGVAGDFVGVVEFPASQTAYRIEPSGPGKTSELVERPLSAVICVKMPRAPTSATQPASKRPTTRLGKLTAVAPQPSQEGIVLLESLHGANPVIYLDFAGGYTPSWGGITYERPDVSNDQIREVWSRVAEDYLPFNINVTTDLQVYENAVDSGRERVIITPTDTASPDAGGVAYVGSFNWSGETPCWVFIISGKDCAEACSHEAGHTLGLTHDGQIINGVTSVYYFGQGSGETGWAPIMGVGFYENVSQWSKGEYIDANNPQDQLNTIANANNGVAYRADDAGDTLATSRYLELYADYSASGQGIIERTADTDAFQFTTSGGLVSLRADPAPEGPDLAIQATLCDANETILALSNPQDTLWASLTTNLAAGTYTFKVTGTGRNDPLTNGFSSYASLGYYSITGSVANAWLPTRFQIAEHVPDGTLVGYVLPGDTSKGDPLLFTMVSGNTGNTFVIDSSGMLTVADNTLLDYSTLTTRSGFAVQFELFVDITDLQDGSLDETNRRVVVAVIPAPPLVSVAPSTIDAPAGSTVSLTAVANSTDATWFQFQWLFNGQSLPGAFDPILVLTNIQSWNVGEYLAVVSDGFSSATSGVATVTVDPAGPVILGQPETHATFLGFATSFTCLANGSEPFSYQWQFNGVDLPGATQAQLTLSNVMPAQAGLYHVWVTNSVDSAISSDAALVLVPVAAWGWDTFGQTDLQPALSNVVDVAAGAEHSLALRQDGLVMAWGATNLCAVPAGLSNVVAIAAAADHSLALKSDGTVAAWGSDAVGQLDLPAGATSIVAIAAGHNCTLALNSSGQVFASGAGTTNPIARFPVLTNITAIAAGSNHCLALRADGGVIAWGDDSFGQSDVPTNLQNVVAVAAGDLHSLALKSDGTLVAWGSNSHGQTSVPALLSNVVQISAGSLNSYALKADGTLVGWGAGATSWVSLYPDYGQSIVPASVTNVTQVSCGAAHTLALAGGGAPFVTTPRMNQFASAGSRVIFRALATGAFPISYQWQFNGTNLDGATNQLLDLENLSASDAGSYSVVVSNSWGVASSVPALLTVASAAFVVNQPQNQSLCVGTSGSMQVTAGGLPPFTYQWLFNGSPLAGATNSILSFNSVGLNQSGAYSVIISNSVSSATSLPANLSVSDVAAWGLGDNFNGSLNDYGQTSVPNGLTGVVQVAAGAFHSLTLKSDGTVVAWGASSGGFQSSQAQNFGQCAVPPNLSNVVAIAAGRYHSLALRQDGQVIAWGAGTNNPGTWPNYGQSMVPGDLNGTLLGGFNGAIAIGAIAIAAGDYSSLAVKQDGTVEIWGENSVFTSMQAIDVAAYGSNVLLLSADGRITQVSPGGVNTAAPIPVNNAVAIAAGSNFVMALTSDGEVVGWGNILPPQGLANVMEIAAGPSQALALKTDGTVVTWGENDENLAAVPSGLTNVVDIAVGRFHSLAAVGNGAISIRTQPTDRAVSTDNQTVFTVQAIGKPPLRYQWLFNGQDLPGQTNSWYRVGVWGESPSTGGYQVVVTNDSGAVTSRVATVTTVVPVGFGVTPPGNGKWTLSGSAPWFTESKITYGTGSAVQSGVIAQNQTSTLETTITGPGTLSFWWDVSSKQGADFLNFYIDDVKQAGISGQVTWQERTFLIPTGQHSLAWSYEKNGATPAGLDCGFLDQVNYISGYGIAPPGGGTWTVNGSAPWFGENKNTHGSAYAAQSGVITQYQTSTLQTTITGPGSLSFWWQVSSKQGLDFLNFYMENVKQAGISGQVAWQEQTVSVPAGPHSFAWSYEKSSAVPVGSDCGWLDQVVFTLPPPVITTQPTNQIVNAGDPIILSVTATDTTRLTYQWSKDGVNLTNKVTPQLIIQQANSLDSGSYRVLVSNSSGQSVLSSPASVDVRSPQKIVKANWQADGSFQLVSVDSQGIPLQTDQQWEFQPQVSTNLVDWTALPTPTELWFGTLLFFDPYASNSSARFYRVVQTYVP